MEIELIIRANSRDDKATLHLDDKDIHVLRRFLEEYERLSAAGPLQKDIPCGLNVSFTPEAGLVMTPNIPSPDDLAILLHRLRPFLLRNEPFSFQKASTVLGRRMKHAALREALRHIHRLWNGENMSSQTPILLNSRTINTEEVLLEWLNSHEYHRDPEKGAIVTRLRAQVPDALFDWIIVSLTLDKLRAVFSTAMFASLLVDKLKEVRFGSYRYIRAA